MSENSITQSDFDSFVSRFSDYLARANESKKRGNNDYNPLLVIRSAKDEAKLHTRILHSFLDTNGVHYQDDLFLRFFLESLQLKGCEYKNLLEWFGDTANASVEKEYYITNECDKGFIDLYIYNDTKHIILENKVDSGDSYKQIAKYIDNLREKDYENIAVVYLTKIGAELSDKSRDKWKINGNFLECENDKVLYIPISYADEILKKWIGKCQSKSGVGNIANLNYALESYKDIVQIITNNKENTMSIVDFFKEAEDFEMAFEIINNSDKIIQELVKKEMCELFDKEKITNWEIEEKGNYLEIFNTLYEQQFFRYKFVLGRISGGKIFGVRLYEENLPKEKGNLPQEISKHQYADTKLEGRWLKGWVSYTFDYCKVKNFKDYFVKNYEIVNKINEEIAKLAKEVKDCQIDS